MSEARETRLLMIAPSSEITPDQLSRTIHSMGKEITVKETCYGCLIEGPRAVVREVLGDVRTTYPNDIFSKVRAYVAGDSRRCRAQHGTRPGYAQLESEWNALSYVSAGLVALEKGEKPKELPEKKQLSVQKFKKICEAN